jgi:ribonucleoside-diphosphate reductase alpha chain
MRWLASRFLDTDTQEELGILTPEVRARKMGYDASIGAEGGTAGPTNGGTLVEGPVAPTTAMTDKPPVVPAKLVGVDVGPACQQCGGIMQRTGSCYTCPSCGNNTGCG